MASGTRMELAAASATHREVPREAILAEMSANRTNASVPKIKKDRGKNTRPETHY
ncbi:MAG: hypothetical protein WA789_19030 [Candidatus Acidiferrum sp.]